MASPTASTPTPSAADRDTLLLTPAHQRRSLQQRQRDAVLAMLYFNEGVPPTTAAIAAASAAATSSSGSNSNNGLAAAAGAADVPEDVVWKVLVYDRFGRDVIAPLLRVGELREHGVTLHMLLHADRQPIPDVPAVYFVEPTTDNIRRISGDLATNLYDLNAINFLSAVPRPLLEDLAAAAVKSDSANNIIKVYDQYLNYITLEPQLFTLNYPDAYLTLNSTSSDSEVEAAVDRIVSGLFSVLVTLGDVPVIRCARGNAAEMIAQKLDQRMRDHLANARQSLFSEEPQVVSHQRPVLILLDRNMDLGTIVQHAWSYEPLVHDVLDMRMNRVAVEITEGSQTKKKEYDLDQRDLFWVKNANVPFPQVAENVDIELAKYKEAAEKITRLSGGVNMEELKSGGTMAMPTGVDTEALRTAVSTLPQLNETKRMLDMHMNVATSLLKAIKARQLDMFYNVEENITRQTRNSIVEIIKDTSKGTPEDKLRLALMYFLSVEEVSDADTAELEAALNAAGSNTGALAYVKQLRNFGRMSAMTSQPATKNSADTLFGLRALGSRWTEGLMESGLMDNAVQMLKSGVNSLKTILPSDKTLIITKIVDTIMENKVGSEVDSYLYFDPKSSKRSDGRAMPKNRLPTQSAIVFVVGGGNYIEHLNLQQYSNNAINPKVITYGSTDLINSRQFLKQLQELSRPAST